MSKTRISWRVLFIINTYTMCWHMWCVRYIIKCVLHISKVTHTHTALEQAGHHQQTNNTLAWVANMWCVYGREWNLHSHLAQARFVWIHTTYVRVCVCVHSNAWNNNGNNNNNLCTIIAQRRHETHKAFSRIRVRKHSRSEKWVRSGWLWRVVRCLMLSAQSGAMSIAPVGAALWACVFGGYATVKEYSLHIAAVRAGCQWRSGGISNERIRIFSSEIAWKSNRRKAIQIIGLLWTRLVSRICLQQLYLTWKFFVK